MKHIVLLVLALLVAHPAMSEEAPPPSAGTRISVDYPDQDIRTILRKIADTFEINVVIPDTLNGRTSLKLRDVTWEQAYRVMLEPIGWKYEVDGDVIKILPKDPKSVTSDSNPDELLSTVSEMQRSMVKSALRDKDYADATAEFYWNLYTALNAKGFSKDQAMKIVIATGASGTAVQ